MKKKTKKATVRKIKGAESYGVYGADGKLIYESDKEDCQSFLRGMR